MTEVHAALVVLLAAIFSALIGLPLLFRGLRGRRVGDHPLCRRCGFDQTGKPAASDRCAECGADLHRRRAVTIGVRHRRWLSLGAGICGCGLSIYAVLPSTSQRLQITGWNTLKPLWLLEREASSGDEEVYQSAWYEIARRLDLHLLNAKQIAVITQHAFSVQADTTLPWRPAWGAWIEARYRTGEVSLNDLQRYVRQANFQFSLQLPRYINRTTDRPWIVVDHDYSGRYGGFGGWVPFIFEEKQDARLTIDDKLLAIPPSDFDKYHEGDAMVNPTGRFGFGMPLPPDLPLGPHHLRLRETIVVREGERDNTAELRRYNVDLSGDFTYIDSIADPPTMTALRAGLKVQRLTRSFRGGNNNAKDRAYDLTVVYHGPPLRVASAFAVSLVYPDSASRVGESADLGGLAIPSGTTAQTWHLHGVGGGRMIADRCDIQLTTVNAPVAQDDFQRPDEFVQLHDRFSFTGVLVDDLGPRPPTPPNLAQPPQAAKPLRNERDGDAP